MHSPRTKVEKIETIQYEQYYIEPLQPWFKFTLNTNEILIATETESIYVDEEKGIRKISKHRIGPLYFTYINNQMNFRQLGYCVDKDNHYHYFSSLINEWDDAYHHVTFAVANTMLDILYVSDY